MIKMINRIEDFAKNRPAAFWLLTTLVTLLVSSVPVIAYWERIKPYLVQKITLPMYALVLFLVPVISAYLIGRKAVKSSDDDIKKRLEALLEQLNNPFDNEEPNFPARGKTVKKYFPYEILGCFGELNEIVRTLKAKQPNKFRGVNTVNRIPEVPIGDWIPESEVQNLKSNVVKLIKLLR